MGLFIKQNNQLVSVSSSSVVRAEPLPNVHFSSTTPPEDTTKLWVKTDNAIKAISIKKDLNAELTNQRSSVLYNTAHINPQDSSVRWEVIVNNKMYCLNADKSATTYASRIFDITDLDNVTSEAWNTSFLFSFSTQTYLYPSMCAFGSDIYFFGGLGDNPAYSSFTGTKIVKYNTITNEWSVLNTELPSKNAFMCSVKLGNYIYVFGGYYQTSYGSYQNPTTIYRFNPSDNQIVNIGNFGACSNYQHTSFVYGSKIYSMGYIYRSSTDTRYPDTVRCFDTLTNTTTTLYNGNKTTDFGTQYAPCVIDDKFYYSYYNSGTSGDWSIWYFDLTDNTNHNTGIIISSTGSDYGKYWLVRDSYIYMLGTNTCRLPLEVTLEKDNLLIVDSSDGNGHSFNIINENALKDEIFPSKVFIGDSNNKMQSVDAALYDEDTQTWTNI